MFGAMVYLFVTGGVASSLGKGVLTGALGALLERAGHHVTCMKLDPYINVDPGTISPSEHGEVYVTSDGAETDLDLGYYERFLSVEMHKDNSVTTGKVYSEVIRRERKGEYLGATVQVIPHVTDFIQSSIEKVAGQYDVTLVEIGGTVGDIESLPFLEAIRQMRIKHGFKQVMYMHLTLLPYLETSGEVKTKPTQHSVKELRSIGIQPDILVCRSISALCEVERKKIALFTNVAFESVLSVPDVASIYSVPDILFGQGVIDLISSHTGLMSKPIDLAPWNNLVEQERLCSKEVTIVMVGKYSGVGDAYKSLREAIRHAAIDLKIKVELQFVNADDTLSSEAKEILSNADALLVPGGFGPRGSVGKIEVIRWARENKLPFLGICFGMQLAVIEFCQSVLGLEGANSTEIDSDCGDPVVCLISELKSQVSGDIGGTMRLGAIEDVLVEGTFLREIYGSERVSERHRHRYEVNPKYVEAFEQAGLRVCSYGCDTGYVDAVEIADHPWFIACQCHPEFTSKPLQPHPLFKSFLKAAESRRLSK